jgi:hypothetical protein
MTVSGLPEPCTHHAQSICHLALDMMEIAGQVKVDEEPVQVRMGYVSFFQQFYQNQLRKAANVKCWCWLNHFISLV